MIKIIYEQPAYCYEHAGEQPYNIKTEIELNSDISSTEALMAFMRMLEIATYRVSANTLRQAAEEWEAEYGN